MKSKLTLILSLILIVCFSSVGVAYDAGLAQSYAKFFQPVAGANMGKALHLVTPEKLVKDLQEGRQVVVLDVRTPNEFGVFGMTLPDSLSIPVNDVFLPENLDRIPEDKQVVIICKSGARSIAVGTALRHVGFKNVYILKGGLSALSNYLSAKTANPPKKVAAR
jgi:rhodanese-related sulfurtransferase